MKKLLSICLAVMMLTVVASAAAADWNVGNGFHLVDADWNVLEENTPVVVTDTADGVQVTHGGAYQNGTNWGGIASKEAYNLNGLEVTVRFDKIPEVTAANDCWIAIDFLEKGQMFDVADVAGNRGFMQLIRYGRPYLEVYEGTSAFSQVYNTQADPRNDLFTVATGDTLKMRVDYVDGLYQFTFAKNDEEPFVIPYEFKQLTEAFKQGKAHIAIAASLKESTDYETYTYTVLEVKDGEEKTAEIIAAEDQAIADAEARKAEEEAAKKAAEEEAKRLEEEAKAAEEAAKAEQEALEAAGVVEAPEADDAAEEAPEAEEGSNLGLIIGIIAAIVVVAAIVLAVVLKKKK